VVRRDLYDVLDVARDASTAELRRAYRRRVRATHPDTGGDPVRFREVQEAWEVLSDPRGRAAYDAATTDVSVELAAAFERARAQVVRPRPTGPAARDRAVVQVAAFAVALVGAGVAAATVTAAIADGGAAALAALPGLLADAVLVVVPAVLVTALSGRSAPGVVVAGAGAGVVAVSPLAGGVALLPGPLLLAAAAVGAGVATLVLVVSRRPRHDDGAHAR